jgi:hypothetical protein
MLPDLDTKILPVLGLLALIPVVLYIATESPVVVLSFVSVLVIVVALLFMFMPSEESVKAVLRQRTNR